MNSVEVLSIIAVVSAAIALICVGFTIGVWFLMED